MVRKGQYLHVCVYVIETSTCWHTYTNTGTDTTHKYWNTQEHFPPAHPPVGPFTVLVSTAMLVLLWGAIMQMDWAQHIC